MTCTQQKLTWSNAEWRDKLNDMLKGEPDSVIGHMRLALTFLNSPLYHVAIANNGSHGKGIHNTAHALSILSKGAGLKAHVDASACWVLDLQSRK